MREDFIETLDKMFPDGYVIVYTNPNKTVRASLYNPNKYSIINDAFDKVKEVSND